MKKLKIHKRVHFLTFISILLLFSQINVGLAQTQDEDFQYWHDHQGDGPSKSTVIPVPLNKLANKPKALGGPN